MAEGLVPIYVMGRRYEVPDGLTIMSAMEWIGYKFIRGCGCRGGFCGACATVYRLPGDYHLKGALACQTTVIPNMYFTEIPYFPAQKPLYNLDELDNPAEALFKMFPEIKKCVGCGECAKACPQKIRPIDYIAAALRGDWKLAADLSFDCIMCGLCAARCTGQLAPYNIALFIRRFYCKNVRPKPQQIIDRNKEILNGKYDKAVNELVRLSEAELKKKYDNRDFEKL
ncbi:MAG: 4Fe-4S dicluster domain-containing protein [Desulfitobacteriaceae bacterium]|nr:4Fe-4S dicluster domain-containing protein [Desulfitobacteriaceae bacterium]